MNNNKIEYDSSYVRVENKVRQHWKAVGGLQYIKSCGNYILVKQIHICYEYPYSQNSKVDTSVIG